ncbi:nucleopolyhedrovirus P10 family protein [Streptomyces sp. bgisy100]|uniref:nucleopolyhedrovirus P10 family protein n=1 Tax=Streptomyces sp. bgisy100 TaxID=3413783 RepID=UPI003D73787D
MTADGWIHAVRQQLGLGRLLPLGGPRDGAWITERAAAEVLRKAVDPVEGVRLGRLRISLVDPGSAEAPLAPPPPSALPPGPLRIEADFAAAMRLPLHEAATRAREALLTAAEDRLGLTVAEADLRATDLLDEPSTTPGGPRTGPGTTEAEPSARQQGASTPDALARHEPESTETAGAPRPTDAPQPAGPPEATESGAPAPSATTPRSPERWGDVTAAACAVPGVIRLAAALAGPAVRVEDRTNPEQRHVQVQLAVSADHRTLDVARAVRTAVTIAAALESPGPVRVAVVITAVEPGPGRRPPHF